MKRVRLTGFAAPGFVVLAVVAAVAVVPSDPAQAKKGKDDLQALELSQGGRGHEIDDRRLQEEGGRGHGSDNSGRHGRPKNGDAIEAAKSEAEKEARSGEVQAQVRYSEPLAPDRDRF